MATNNKNPNVVFGSTRTVKGTVRFFDLHQARAFSPDSEPAYTAVLEVAEEDADPVREAVAEVAKALEVPTAQLALPARQATEQDGTPVPMTLEVRFRVRQFSRSGRDNRPAFFNAASPPEPIQPVFAPRGSEVAVAFSPRTYKLGPVRGVTLVPEAVQIIRLAEGGPSRRPETPEAFGFEAVVGGYTGRGEAANGPEVPSGEGAGGAGVEEGPDEIPF